MAPRSYSQLYRRLRSVDPTDYQRIIRQYEEREREIGHLDIEEYFELTVAYVDALFQTGAYRRHQMAVDRVIHYSIEHNFRTLPDDDRDIFHQMLLRKAAAAYRLSDYPTAEHVIRELIRINPGQPTHTAFLRIVLFKQRQRTLQWGRGLFIFCMLTGAALVTLNLLLIKPFYPGREALVSGMTAVTLLSGVLLLVLVYGGVLLRSHSQAREFQAKAKNKRRR